MAWTTPKTWTTGEALTAGDLNTHLRDNLSALKAPPTATYTLNESANYTTTSTTFVNIDATNLSLTITTTGGDVLIGFFGTCNSTTISMFFDVTIDGVRMGGDDGLVVVNSAILDEVSFVVLKTGLAAGAHTFRLQWKVSSSSAILYAGAGTANADVHPQFWVREV